MTPTPNPPLEDPIRPHTYDGIQEYDKRLPNWWLNTLYITIVFWVGYWSYYEWFRVGKSGAEVVSAAVAKIEADRLSSTKLDDASLWKMSQNAAFVAAGLRHLAGLTNQPVGPAVAADEAVVMEDVADGAEAAGELLLVEHEGHQGAGVEHVVEHQHPAVPQHQHGDDHG